MYFYVLLLILSRLLKQIQKKAEGQLFELRLVEGVGMIWDGKKVQLPVARRNRLQHHASI